MDSFMYKVIALCLCFTIFSGCHKKPEENTAQNTELKVMDVLQQKKLALVNEFSGVWSEDNYLFTIYHDGTNIHFIVDDSAKEVRLGDVDLENETVNLLITKIEDDQQGIITLRRNWVGEDKKNFTLTYTNFDGSQGELSFVRQIGNDDKTRIENIYTHQLNNTYEEDVSTPAYDVSHESIDEEDLIEADRIATAAANSAKMAAYEAHQAALAAEAEEAHAAAVAATEAAEAMDY